ncbi:MAG: ParM/StbA family protein [Clostridium saudiense]|uniref:ParM/StbA family protein n=1 Tax=Clostridium saudiense TaxID=1414720 RepID=UPI00220A1BA1|nr:ParM/StbA family protein [Clostridium saudiense]MDU3522198.1 ParM/StbA family protein [Clostridium saudiense]UVX78417.1 MAG: MreB/Mbl protein [Bacteriophage sp.]
MKKIILSADIGKYETELIGRDLALTADDRKTVRFRTKMYDLAEGYIDVEGNSHLVELNKKSYIVGEQGQDKSEDTSKTQFLHQIACYTAITQFIEPGTKDNDIYMVLACPLSVLLIQDAKEEYKEFIKGKGPIKIAVDGKDYEFEIKDIMIKAEGSGIIYLEPNLFNDQAVGIVDLGGLNMGWSLYNNKVCKKDDRFIEECGTDRLIDIVREQLAIYKKGNLVNKEIAEKALNEGGLKKAGKIDTESTVYVEKAKELYFEEVLKNIKAHKFNIDELDRVVFVGGTSQHIKENITNKLNHSYIPVNSQLSTVEGLYKVAFKKYGK